LRPDSILIGMPPVNYVPFDSSGLWTSFAIDYISIQASQGSVPPTTAPQTTPSYPNLTAISTITPLFNSQQPTNPPSPSLAETSLLSSTRYYNGQYGFSIIPPSGWILNETSTSNGVSVRALRIVGPDISNANENPIIEIRLAQTNLNFSEYVSELSQTNLQNFFSNAGYQNFRIISQDFKNVGGYNCTEIAYSFTAEGINFNQHQCIFVENGFLYTILFSAFASNYDSYLPPFEQSFQTFKIEPIENNVLLILVSIGAVTAIVIAVVVVAVYAKQKRQNELNLQGKALL
jgi:hypothetical protein